ncbi:MAG: UDP-N-acetylenolpyruvoylglucosamine reductase [Paludibacter sp. 47-17]|nr:MAG: UDP-N-acetylenolpyruvoylglucosamine reductase [Paludibacter sp. 47-17]
MKVINNFVLTNYNSYRINAICSKAWFPDNEFELMDVFKRNKKPIILGNGNNIILSKNYYDEEFIVFNGNYNNVNVQENLIVAESGATLLHLSEVALFYNLSGLELFYDIPSSVGGAVVMNAGTKEKEIKDILIKVRYLDLVDMQFKEILKDEIQFEYRNSFFQKNTDKVVIKAWFELQQGDHKVIKSKMEETKRIRWEKQPREYPNCGSVFKRPPGRFVGPMLDELNMKGFAVGGAKISEKHSGFIVNFNNATGNDILAVISEAQRRVKERFNVDLEVEQRVI